MDEWIKSILIIVVICINNILMIMFGYETGRKSNGKNG